MYEFDQIVILKTLIITYYDFCLRKHQTGKTK